MIEFNRRETMAKESKKVDSVEGFLKKLKINGDIKWTLNQNTSTEKEINLKDLLTEYATQQKESVVSDEEIRLLKQFAEYYNSLHYEVIDDEFINSFIKLTTKED